jgi:hypothetical protein
VCGAHHMVSRYILGSIMRMTVHLGPPKGMVNYKNAIM